MNATSRQDLAGWRGHEPIDWFWAATWVGIILFCLAFWFGVGYGLNVGYHAIRPNHPKPAPPPVVHHPKPEAARVVCSESSPPLPHIYTAITCTQA